ncbi:hypothetical protein B0H14DRAFT_2596345 [Mycena olivaceomarginata]|nr:hypothetical protein B0H14DRAFT_2596345 [Mycena olivaceomarginata]
MKYRIGVRKYRIHEDTFFCGCQTVQMSSGTIETVASEILTQPRTTTLQRHSNCNEKKAEGAPASWNVVAGSKSGHLAENAPDWDIGAWMGTAGVRSRFYRKVVGQSMWNWMAAFAAVDR